jgi:hypothetical protein
MHSSGRAGGKPGSNFIHSFVLLVSFLLFVQGSPYRRESSSIRYLLYRSNPENMLSFIKALSCVMIVEVQPLLPA